MTRAEHIELGKMTLEEFRAWFSAPGNPNKLPLFHNTDWLKSQSDPVALIYNSMVVWCQKYPIPTPEEQERIGQIWKQ